MSRCVPSRVRAVRATGLLLLLALALPAQVRADVVRTATAPTGIPSLQPHHLDPGFWIARADAATVMLDATAIERHNATLRQREPSLHDLAALSRTLSRDAVLQWLRPLSTLPATPLYGEDGNELDPATLNAVLANAAITQLPPTLRPGFGLILRRTAMRRFPTALRALRQPHERDLDRFQESALFPGTPVALLHRSADRRWWFVLAPDYAAWIDADAVAAGSRREVLDHARATPHLVVTGAQVRTAFSPSRPALSQLLLDMGTRVPLHRDWPADALVDGQHPYASHVIALPQRGPDGTLERVPALLPRSADVSHGALVLTEAALLAQAFKFLGERYGWGHDYDARDCSGFVAEVYRAFGVTLPRNTGDQARADGGGRIALDPALPPLQRRARLDTLQIGDLLYIPGHVMMVIGRDQGLTWVIHDTAGIHWRDAGQLRRTVLNQVAVTPLEPLLHEDGSALVDRIHAIQRLRAGAERR